ncbi:MAG: hypothetical protein Q8N59_02785 [bacterium]|nr:hypothetical protein [bacterium]
MITDILNTYKVILGFWWIWLPIALFFVLRWVWLTYIHTKFIEGLIWTTLELKFPREAVKSPKAMEQFFTGLHATEKPIKFKDKYLKGELPAWFSIEIVGRGGMIHIFIRTQAKFRNLIESSLFAQYPEAEIQEVEDYIGELPFGTPNQDYDMWGTELLLTQPDAYPIRTYPFFFQEKEGEERTDPLAGLFEFLISLTPKEHAWIQILISPTNDDWKKEAEKLVAKILGKEVKTSKSGSLIIKETVGWIDAFVNGIADFFTGPTEKKEEKKEVKDVVAYLSPGQKDAALAIEANIAKFGFKTIIRYMYWGHTEVFTKDKVSAFGGFFKQFGTQNLNGFIPNKKITTGPGKIFKKSKEIKKKKFLIGMYKRRFFPFARFKARGFVFNTEELATVFHIPTKFVKVSKMPTVEAKKGSPPTALPTI